MKVLLLEESTRDMYPSVISIRHVFSKFGVSLANIMITCFTVNIPANFPVKVKSRCFTFALA